VREIEPNSPSTGRSSRPRDRPKPGSMSGLRLAVVSCPAATGCHNGIGRSRWAEPSLALRFPGVTALLRRALLPRPSPELRDEVRRHVKGRLLFEPFDRLIEIDQSSMGCLLEDTEHRDGMK